MKKNAKTQKTFKTIHVMRAKVVTRVIVVCADEKFEYLINDKYWNYNKFE